MVQKISLRQQFQKLAETWQAETIHISSSSQMALHPAYQRIIGMGPDAIPLLLEELQKKPDRWSWALRAITGENPVKEEHRGKLALIAQDWIEWGKVNGVQRETSLTERFQKLVDVWRHECQWLSSIHDLATHPAYQQIIGMGPDAIPLLLTEMQHDPDHWSWALEAIAGEDPLKDEHRGDLDQMANDWVDWGKEHGYLPKSL